MAAGSKLVSVLLPCHNAERFLRQAMDSVLAQSYGDLEVLAVDDGSEDSTRMILDQYAAADARVRVLTNESRLGLIRTLNRAVGEAKGELIARMDADDENTSDRIKTQVATLESRPEIGLIGSGAWRIDESGAVIGQLPVRCVGPEATPFLALFATPAIHPTLMARAQLMRAYAYREADECLHAEDYDLLVRMLSGGASLINLDQPLYRHRVNPEGVSLRFERDQIANFVDLAAAYLERTLGVGLEPGTHRVLVNRIDPSVSARDLFRGLQAIDRVEDAFLAKAELGERGRTEVRAVAIQQRVDVLGQAVLKGTVAQRTAGSALLARYFPNLLSSPARRHLRAKRGRGASTRYATSAPMPDAGI